MSMEAMYYPLVPRESPLDLSVKTVQKTTGPSGNYVGMILEQNRISSSQGNNLLVPALPPQNFPSNSIPFDTLSNNHPFIANSQAGSHPVMTSLLQQTSHVSNYNNPRMPNLPHSTISTYAGQNNSYTALPIHTSHSQDVYSSTCFAGNIVPVQKNRVHSEASGQTSNGWNFQISQHSEPFYQHPIVTHPEYHTTAQEAKHTLTREYGYKQLDASNKCLSSATHNQSTNSLVSAVDSLTNSNILSQQPLWNTSGLSTLTFPSAVAPSPLPHIKKKEGADSCQKDSPRTARDFPEQPHQVTPFSKTSGGLLNTEDIVMIDDCAQVGSMESFKLNQLHQHISSVGLGEIHQSIVQPSQSDSDLSPNSCMPCLKAVSPNENRRNISSTSCPLGPPPLIKAVSSPNDTNSVQETSTSVILPTSSQKFWQTYQDQQTFFLENSRVSVQKANAEYCKDMPMSNHYLREQLDAKSGAKLLTFDKYIDSSNLITCLSQSSHNIIKISSTQQLLKVPDKSAPSLHTPSHSSGQQCITSSIVSSVQPSIIPYHSRIVHALQNHTVLSSAMMSIPEEQKGNQDISKPFNSQDIDRGLSKLGIYCDNSEKSKIIEKRLATKSNNQVEPDNGIKQNNSSLRHSTLATSTGHLEEKFQECSTVSYSKPVLMNNNAMFSSKSEFVDRPIVKRCVSSLPSIQLVPSKSNHLFSCQSVPEMTDIEENSQPVTMEKLNTQKILADTPDPVNGISHQSKFDLQENIVINSTVTSNSINDKAFSSSCSPDFKTESTRSFRKRSMLQCLADSKGYVAEKKKRSNTNDLFADPSQLSREDRALQRAMLRFKQLEKKHVQSSDTPSTRLRSSRASKRKAQDKGEDSSESLSDSERRSRTSFIDFQPEVLSSRTRHQKAICHQPKRYNRNAAYEEELKKEAKRLANLRARRKLRRRLLLRINKKSSSIENYVDYGKIKIKKEPIPLDSSIIDSTEFVSNDVSMASVNEVLKCKYLKEPGVALKSENIATASYDHSRNQTISDMTAFPVYSLMKSTKLSKGRACYQATRRRIKSGLDMIARKKKTNKKRKILPFVLKVNHDGRQMGIPDLKKLIVNKSLGETPLHRAARQGNLKLVLLCLSTKFCNVNATDNANYTPLHEACAKGHLSVARALLENGANIDACATGGVRPIHDAVENDHVEISRLLLSYGSDPTIATYSGKTPSSLARSETMKQFLNGFLSDVSLETPCAWISKWQFAGSAKCLDPKKTGFDVCDNAMLDCGTKRQEEDQDFLFELSETPFLPTFLFSWSNEKKVHNYLRLYDVLKQTGFSKEEFRERFPKLTILVVPRHDFESRAVCCQLFITPESVEPASYHISLVLYDDVARSILGIDTLHIR